MSLLRLVTVVVEAVHPGKKIAFEGLVLSVHAVAKLIGTVCIQRKKHGRVAGTRIHAW